MSNPKFYAANKAGMYFVWSAGAASGYPVENLNDYLISTQTKSSSVAAGQTLIVYLGAGFGANYILLENHNFYNLGVSSIKVEMANDLTFTTNYVLLAEPTSGFTDPFILEFGFTTRAYLRLKFEKSGDLSDYPIIGNFFIGKYLGMPYPYNMNHELNNKQFNTTVKEALGGVIRTSRQIAGRKRLEVEFTLLTDSFVIDWQALMNVIQGRLNPFYFIDEAGVIHYVHFEEDYIPAKGRRYNVNDLVRLKMRHQVTG